MRKWPCPKPSGDCGAFRKYAKLSWSMAGATMILSSLRAAWVAGCWQLLNSRGLPVDHLTDGDDLRLRITEPVNASQAMQVSFILVGSGTTLGECTIEAGQDHCDSEIFDTLGWSWDKGGVLVQQRAVQANAGGTILATS